MRLTKDDTVLIPAIIAAALSFTHIMDVAEWSGQGGWKAWAYPISVDWLMVEAGRRIRAGRQVRQSWFWFSLGLAASIAANLATAGLLGPDDVPTPVRLIVAGWPAVAFLGCSVLVHGRKAAPVPEVVPPTPRVSLVRQRPKARRTKPAPVADLVTVPRAHELTGVPAPTIRGWVHRNRMAYVVEDGRKLVSVARVRELAGAA